MCVCVCVCVADAQECMSSCLWAVVVVVAVCVCVGVLCGLYTSQSLNRKCKLSTDVCVTAILCCVRSECV